VQAVCQLRERFAADHAGLRLNISATRYDATESGQRSYGFVPTLIPILFVFWILGVLLVQDGGHIRSIQDVNQCICRFPLVGHWMYPNLRSPFRLRPRWACEAELNRLWHNMPS
jgi:hypothetical protein